MTGELLIKAELLVLIDVIAGKSRIFQNSKLIDLHSLL